MKINTKMHIGACGAIVAATVVSVWFFETTFPPLFIFAVALIILTGMLLGGAFTERGMVYEFKELSDGVYTFLGEVGGVYVLRYVDEKGEDVKFSITELCHYIAPERVITGMSFRKVGEKVIIL